MEGRTKGKLQGGGWQCGKGDEGPRMKGGEVAGEVGPGRD